MLSGPPGGEAGKNTIAHGTSKPCATISVLGAWVALVGGVRVSAVFGGALMDFMDTRPITTAATTNAKIVVFHIDCLNYTSVSIMNPYG